MITFASRTGPAGRIVLVIGFVSLRDRLAYACGEGTLVTTTSLFRRSIRVALNLFFSIVLPLLIVIDASFFSSSLLKIVEGAVPLRSGYRVHVMTTWHHGREIAMACRADRNLGRVVLLLHARSGPSVPGTHFHGWQCGPFPRAAAQLREQVRTSDLAANRHIRESLGAAVTAQGVSAPHVSIV